MTNLPFEARQLDRKLLPLKRFRVEPPRAGWIRVVRRALGMSQRELASRLHVSQPTVDGYERAEGRGAVTLASLRRVADALDCDLQYVLVPRRGLERSIRVRASELAEQLVRRTSHSMRMELQGVGAAESRRQVHELARALAAKPPRGFWSARR